jgi:hypothetical protein
MTVKNPFPKPNHDPPPEIVCVINMKAWEVSEVVAAVLHLAQSVSKIQPIQDVTDHEALIRWVRGITDLAHSRVSDQGRIYDHVEAYIVSTTTMKSTNIRTLKPGHTVRISRKLEGSSRVSFSASDLLCIAEYRS